MGVDLTAWKPAVGARAEWHIIDPTGGIEVFGRTTREKPAAHTIEIHEGGSITVSRSLVNCSAGTVGSVAES